MRDLRQAMLGVLAALLSSAIILGSIVLAFAEDGQSLSMAYTPTSSPSPLPPVDTPKPGEPTFTPSPTSLPTSTSEPIASANCPAPTGWTQIEVLPGDTLASLAQSYGITAEALAEANCLPTHKLFAGVFLYIPGSPPTSTPTATQSPTPTEPPPPTPTRRVKQTCGRPAGWVIYIVQRKDTLYSIATAHYTSVVALKSANCLTSNLIRVGQRLYVPNVSTRTPVVPPTATPPPPTPTATSPPANTQPPPPTDPPAPTNTAVPTDTPTNTPITPPPTEPPTSTPITPTATDVPPEPPPPPTQAPDPPTPTPEP